MRMLGKYAFLAALLAALSLALFVSCPPPGDDDDDPPVYELDERLLELRWNHGEVKSYLSIALRLFTIPELGYYTFSEADDDSGDYFLTVHDTPDNFPLEEDVPYSVYSKNGFIYLKDTKRKIMKYQFHDEWPFIYDPNFPEASASGMSSVNYLIRDGEIKVMTYRLYEEDDDRYLWDDGRGDNKWALKSKLPDYVIAQGWDE